MGLNLRFVVFTVCIAIIILIYRIYIEDLHSIRRDGMLVTQVSQESGQANSPALDVNHKWPPLMFPPAKNVSMGTDKVVTRLSFCDHVVVKNNVAAPWREAAAAAAERVLPAMRAQQSDSHATTCIATIRLLSDPVARTRASEHYSLRVLVPQLRSTTTTKAELVAADERGMQWALSALLQVGTSPVHIPLPLEVSDAPDVPWRGLMIDTARHYMPMSELFKVVDGMWLSRLNVLHLHLTDAQAFPLRLNDVHTRDGRTLRLARLAELGAIDADSVYTREDMEALVRYAAARGVEVVPEVDLPAHAASWGKAFPELVVDCSATAAAAGARVPLDTFMLDPSKPDALDVAVAVLAQVADWFPSRYMHVGADELVLNCWRDTPHLREWVVERQGKTQALGGSHAAAAAAAAAAAGGGGGGGRAQSNISSTDAYPGVGVPDDINIWREILRDFETGVFDALRKVGKTPMVWQGLVDEGGVPDVSDFGGAAKTETGATPPAPRPIVEPWKCWSRLAPLAAQQGALKGMDVLNGACLYLDWSHTDMAAYLSTDQAEQMAAEVVSHGDGTDEHEEGQDERHGSATHLAKGRILGGEVVMFTENADVANVQCRLWPRAGAGSASLWHAFDGRMREAVLSVDGAASILAAYVHYRYTLRLLGVSASPITMHILEDMSNTTRPAGTTSAVGTFGTAATAYGSQGMMYEAVTTAESGVVSPSAREYTLLSQVAHMSPGALATPRGQASPTAPIQPTSQCPPIPTTLQRPLAGWSLSGNATFTQLAHLNAGEGAPGDREELLRQWLYVKASEGTAVVGLCEMNNWHNGPVDPDSFDTFRPATKAFSRLRTLGEETGFPFWHVIHSNHHPYNIGILAADEFVVMGEYGPLSSPPMQRGLLWVFFPRRRLHVMVVHLHAQDPEARTAETFFVQSLIRPLVQDNAQVVLMGDMNTLSSQDRRVHDEMRLPNKFYLKRTLGRLKRKFCRLEDTGSLPEAGAATSAATNTTSSICRINYSPYDTLISAGLFESCHVTCSGIIGGKPELTTLSDQSWSLRAKDSLSRCMQRRCQSSEPTSFNPEWPPSKGLMPPLRLDFMLVSQAVLDSASAFTSEIEKNNLTNHLSDHYPVKLRWYH